MTDPRFNPNCIACVNIRELRELDADDLGTDDTDEAVGWYLGDLKTEGIIARNPGQFCRPHGGTL